MRRNEFGFFLLGLVLGAMGATILVFAKDTIDTIAGGL